MDKPIVMKL